MRHASALLILLALVALAFAHTRTRTLYREHAPISKHSTRAQASWHFHLGQYTSVRFVGGAVCYLYQRSDWLATFCTPTEGPQEIPMALPVQP